MIRPSTLVALTFVLGVAFPAAAAPKVALTAIDGDASGDVRDAVAEALDGNDLTLIGEKETNRAVDKLGDLSELSEKQAKKLGADLEADAVVHGKLEKQGGSRVIKFNLFVHGHKAKGFSVQFSNAKSKKFKEALHDKMLEKLKAGQAAEPADEDKDKTDKPAKKKKVAKAAEDEEDPTPKAKKTKKAKKDKDKPAVAAPAEEEEEAEVKPRKTKKKTAAKTEETDEDEGSITVRAPSLHSANRVAARADVGMSVSARRLIFTSTAQLDNKPTPFRPGPVAGARFDADVYPLAFSNPNSPAAGLGLGVEYDKVVSSHVRTSGGAEPNVTMTVKQQHYFFAGRYRLAFGKTPTTPTITFGFGYGRRTFVVKNTLMDRNNLDLPDTDYKFLAPELGFRFPLGTPYVAFIAGGNAMLVRDAGGIQKANSYGRAKIFGIDTQAGLDITLGNRFAFRVVGEFTQIGYTFTGGGDQANNRDGNPATVDIGGAADRSFGGAATLAVLY